MSNGKDKFEKFSQDAANSSKEMLEASIKCSNIAVKGGQEISGLCASHIQQLSKASVDAAKNLMTCKTLTECAEEINKATQQNWDASVKNSTKVAEMMSKIVADCMEPLNTQINKAIKKATDSMAA